jgi:Ca2+-binding RTX toxin-like protein
MAARRGTGALPSLGSQTLQEDSSMALIALLDDPNESFSNDESITQIGTLIEVSGEQNTVNNSGVLWTVNGDDGIVLHAMSTNATVNNGATGYVRGGNAAVFVGGSATINNGGELIGTVTGIDVTSDSLVQINNVFGGTIKGGDIGINFIAGNGSAIANDGIVYGNAGVLLEGSTHLTNSGEIGGAFSGIGANGDTTIANANAGVIWSSGNAINVLAGHSVITNDAASLISGTEKAIMTTNGVGISSTRITLNNFGTIEGMIDCNATDGDVTDVIINRGTITGRIELGEGEDIFNGSGGNGLEVYGEAGNDVLIGGSQGDGLIGGSGGDYLYGGLGKDELIGGAERDFFDFNSIAESKVGANHDLILDFERGIDEIDLAGIDAKSGGGNQAFKFIGTQAFHHVKGELHYKDLGASCLVQGDVNGDGKADFEILVNAASLSAGDFTL